MASNHFKYLGGNCGLVHYFFSKYPGYNDAHLNYKQNEEVIKKTVEENSNLNLIAITADYTQKHIHSLLESCKFKPVLVFYSSHKNPKEVLTFWFRENLAAKNDKNLKIEVAPSNCSVSINGSVYVGYAQRLMIVTTDPKSQEYTKLGSAELWYKIKDEYLVK